MQHKVTHKNSKHTEHLSDAQLKELQGGFTGRQKFADLYDVEEVKEPKKPEPLKEKEAPKPDAKAGK